MPRIVFLLLLCPVLLVLSGASWQRQLLYFPTHHGRDNGLTEWRHQGELIGFTRPRRSPKTVWLMLHGNGGQAADRAYAIPSFPSEDAVYILEYPGYGQRSGSPSRKSIDLAARQAYLLLREKYPAAPVCVVGESLGTGPACALATVPPPPDKIVLVAPFDKLHRVGQYHYPYLPVRLLIPDDWDNIKSLKGYRGRVEIYGIRHDEVIPIKFAKALAESKPGTVFHEIEGGHNDWATPGRVRFQNP